MELLRRVLNAVERIASRAAEALGAGRPVPARIPLPVRSPSLTYRQRRRQRLEWMSHVCNRRF